MSTPFRLLLPEAFVAEILAQARAELPNECCGLLAGTIVTTPDGRVGQVVRRYPLINAAASPVEYLSEPTSMFHAVRDMARHELDLLAIYHSHPTTEPIPSKKDREQNYSDDVMNLILSLKEPPTLRAWWLTADAFREADWQPLAGENAQKGSPEATP